MDASCQTSEVDRCVSELYQILFELRSGSHDPTQAQRAIDALDRMMDAASA